MRLSSGPCSNCSRVGEYGKPLLKLCPVCNEARKRARREEKRPRVPFASSEPEKKTSNPNRKPARRPRKATGEAELFLSIWRARPHVCTNCTAPLGPEPRSFYFAHIVPKGRAPELRLVAENIRLLCFECHRLFDQGTREQFNNRKK